MNGYSLIDSADVSQRQNLPANQGHHVFGDTLSGTLKADFHLRQPLHVGTGTLATPNTLTPRPDNPRNIPLIAAFYRDIHDGRPQVCVPGSSLKGAFRHLYEMITASCLAQADRKLADPGALRACSYDAGKRRADTGLRLCPACRLFGAQGYMGQVFFHGALTTAKTAIVFAPQRWSPRDIDPEARKLYTHQPALTLDKQLPQPKEPLEALLPNTILTITMDFTALTPEELSLLLLLMGQHPDEKIYPKLGGVKAHGWGAVDVLNVRLHLHTADRYLAYESQPQSTNLAHYLLDQHPLLNEDAWAAIKKHLATLEEANYA